MLAVEVVMLRLTLEEEVGGTLEEEVCRAWEEGVGNEEGKVELSVEAATFGST